MCRAGGESMADRNRRFALTAIAFPLLLLVMSGLARAATFTVSNTTDPASPMAGDGSLREAITNANTAGGTNNIQFNAGVTGTITLGSTLPAIVSGETLTISGPTTSPGIAISGGNAVQLMVVNAGATLNLQFLTMEDGSATLGSTFGPAGGAIYNNGTLTVTNSTLSGNQVTNVSFGRGIGGAIYNNGTLTVTDSTLSGNQATGGSQGFGVGGAIWSEGTLSVTDSTLSGNQANGISQGGFGFGGAIFNAGTGTVTDSTLSGNQATVGGGAIENSSGTLTVTNSTLSGNSAASLLGGGIENGVGGTVTLKGTILADESSGGNCALPDMPVLISPITDDGYNISDDDSCGFTMAPSGTSINNSTTLNLDPAGLANNGGPTKTIALEPNSQAVDFIPVLDCTDQSMSPVQLTTDQRGFPRPDPGNPNFCDTGAFELQTMPVVISSNGERVQIARSTAPDSDQVNMAFTFTEIGSPACDAADDAFNGFTVLLRSGSCGALVDDAALELMLEPWAVHTVNRQSYGTIFQSMPPETVSARMVQLPTPAAPACGEWTVNIEVAGVDTSGLGNGPFALILSNPDGDTGCFDVTNAIVGNQIDPPTRTVRRGVRR